MYPHISIAPMMDYSDRHGRYFLRLISPRTRLYSEMISTQTLLHGDIPHLLAYDPSEKYLALQLGGNVPKDLAICAKIGEDWGYDEINLNVGCPSSRVSTGRFGACLMLSPLLVAECIAAMRSVVAIPVTVKCRIGVDDHASYDHLHHFVETVAQTGCKHFIIHARKALLSGLSPKENRTVPPLQYDVVYALKRNFPSLQIILNGGINSIDDIKLHLTQVDGVMIGRAAFSNPYLIACIDEAYGSVPIKRSVIIQAFMNYVRTQMVKGVKLSSMTRHALGLYQGMPGAKNWRRFISEGVANGMDERVLEQALRLVI